MDRNWVRSTTKTISDIKIFFLFVLEPTIDEWFLRKFLIDNLIVADFKMRNAHHI